MRFPCVSFTPLLRVYRTYIHTYVQYIHNTLYGDNDGYVGSGSRISFEYGRRRDTMRAKRARDNDDFALAGRLTLSLDLAKDHEAYLRRPIGGSITRNRGGADLIYVRRYMRGWRRGNNAAAPFKEKVRGGYSIIRL